MQLPTVAAILSLAALGSAQFTTTSIAGCQNGQYSCGRYNGQPAIFICSNGSSLLSAICGGGCEIRNNLPYCV